MNEKAMDFFSQIAGESCTSQTPKLAHNTDFTDLDASFILQFCSKQTNILDIGSGTGLIVNKLQNAVGHIDCIEPQKNFSKFIVSTNNINIFNMTVFEFETEKKYDVITLFGLMNYFSEDEAIHCYKKIQKYLHSNATLIIKNQFGIHDDVIVDGYSEEQGRFYYSSYRHLEKEKNILANLGYSSIQSWDIYPEKANRWHNTHFYAITATMQKNLIPTI